VWHGKKRRRVVGSAFRRLPFRSVQVWSVLAILDLDGYAFVKKNPLFLSFLFFLLFFIV
jgi:hypothetical protein